MPALRWHADMSAIKPAVQQHCNEEYAHARVGVHSLAKSAAHVLQEDVLATIKDWVANPAVAHNATVLLVAGIIYTNEGNYVEALKALHGGELLEM